MLKLNLGCGNVIVDGYINIDIRPTTPQTIVMDVCDLKYDDEVIDEIYACDILEHISHRETVNVLKHWYNKLVFGGKLFIQSPCLTSMIDFYNKSNSIKNIEMVIARIFGGQDYPENTHKTILHPELIKHYLTSIGYKNISMDIGNFGNRTNIRVTTYK
jgi:predicted SAM-dependent methyltransferase